MEENNIYFYYANKYVHLFVLEDSIICHVTFLKIFEVDCWIRSIMIQDLMAVW